MAIYLGIDPGSKGAICFLDPVSKLIRFLPTPCVKYQARTIMQTIQDLDITYNIQHAAIEDVHSIHGTSAKSNFQFGYQVGVVNTLLECTGIGYERIPPKVWQKGVGLKQTKPARKPPQLKKDIAEIAMRLYPNAKLFGPRGGLLDGRADALMLAHYLYIKYGERND